MKDLLKPYLQLSSNIFAQNKTLKFCLVVLVVLQGYQTVQIGRIDSNTQTVVVPMGKPYQYTLKQDSADETYLVDMSDYIVFLIGNLNADNAEYRLETLLTLFHESTYSKYQKYFKDIKREIQKFKSISYTSELKRPNPVYVKDNVLTVHYLRSRIVGENKKTPEKRVVEIRYGVVKGRFYIYELNDAES